MYRLPADKTKKEQWISALELQEANITKDTRVCSRHFLNGDTTQIPSRSLGKRFCSPKKRGSVKKLRLSDSFTVPSKRPVKSTSTTPSASPGPSTSYCGSDSSETNSSLVTTIGEQLLSDYAVHELPGSSTVTASDNVVLNAGLLARVEFLESEVRRLKITSTQRTHFRLEDIMSNDCLVRFYTGFPSYEVFLAVYEFLGPAVNKLHYWGTSKRTVRTGKRKLKLDPKNQFFLTLVRLRLNVRVKDLSVRFGISVGLVSRYITTWICFLYHHFKEINWMPSPEQVAANLPHVFKERYPSTYAIIDGSEIFIYRDA